MGLVDLLFFSAKAWLQELVLLQAGLLQRPRDVGFPISSVLSVLAVHQVNHVIITLTSKKSLFHYKNCWGGPHASAGIDFSKFQVLA